MNALLLRARIVWLVSTPPIENGAVLIRDGQIHDTGSWPELSARWPGVPVEDLGEVALLPGLVNAHCHLDYTGMAGLLSPVPSNHFPDWIKSILALKAHWSYTEYAASWLKGAQQLLDSGCATVYDIEAVPELLPEVWNSTPLQVISFLEMTGIRSGQHPEQIFKQTEEIVARLPETDSHCATFSPHALYSTPPELLRRCAVKMLAENARMSIHLAESEAEWEMYMHSRGPLYDWLKNQRPMDDCGDRSPIQQAHRLGLLQPNLLAIHCNYLAPGDAELLAHNRVTVVHCPRSHAYFNHAPFPYEELRAANVAIAIATDSLASIRVENHQTPTLNLWDELKCFGARHPQVSPESLIEMVVLSPRRSGKSFAKNQDANLITVPFSGPKTLLAAQILEAPLVKDRFFFGIRS